MYFWNQYSVFVLVFSFMLQVNNPGVTWGRANLYFWTKCSVFVQSYILGEKFH